MRDLALWCVSLAAIGGFAGWRLYGGRYDAQIGITGIVHGSVAGALCGLLIGATGWL